ncbi:Uncharacterized protein TCM_013435 [Theobroma cacao]|uniref:Uncharacterized protein n=1 Tax=Theobroma cacao TaxID=3641 RepID=A0A061FVL9_THECC|nr:Uncharacterized protein TCM_013435 [Theobroma cacao]
MKSSQLGEKIKLLQLENSPNGQSFSVEASELKARMRYLEGIQSEIKCKIIELQQENKKLWQEKEEAKSQVHILELENNWLQHILSSRWSKKEKQNLEIKLTLLRKENQQLQYLKEYQDKLVFS